MLIAASGFGPGRCVPGTARAGAQPCQQTRPGFNGVAPDMPGPALPAACPPRTHQPWPGTD
eukprot:5286151-Lingulodinium_polyedra.AAC.1